MPLPYPYKKHNEKGALEPHYDWPTIVKTILVEMRKGRSVARIVKDHGEDWPCYPKVLFHLNRDYFEEYQLAKRLSAEALGDHMTDMLEDLRYGVADFRSAKVFLEGAARRMGQMNSEYNDRRVHHEHTHRVDDMLRKRLEAAEARVRALEGPEPIDGEATEVDEETAVAAAETAE